MISFHSTCGSPFEHKFQFSMCAYLYERKNKFYNNVNGMNNYEQQ